MYYLRSRPAADAIKFTVDVEMLLKDAGQIEIEHPAMDIFILPEILNDKTEKNDDELQPPKSPKDPQASQGIVKCSLRSDDGQCMSCGS